MISKRAEKYVQQECIVMDLMDSNTLVIQQVKDILEYYKRQKALYIKTDGKYAVYEVDTELEYVLALLCFIITEDSKEEDMDLWMWDKEASVYDKLGKFKEYYNVWYNRKYRGSETGVGFSVLLD